MRTKHINFTAVGVPLLGGLMTRFILQNKLIFPNDSHAFDSEGYYYNSELSTKHKPVFTREH